jgi:general L-amino acid transport system substrate-binding protein
MPVRYGARSIARSTGMEGEMGSRGNSGSVRFTPLLALVVALVPAILLAGSRHAAAQTLKAVQDRGMLACGVSQGIIGFSAPGPNGAWSGLDVDFCRALSAAIFNDAGKVKFVPLTAGERFAPLQSGAIDVLSRNSTWTMSREGELGLMFAAVTYYDGQGFMVRRARNVNSALDLDGSKVCVQSGTTTELNLADFFNANGMKYEAITLPTADEVVAAYDQGRCDVFTSDASQLYAERLKLTKPDDHVVLPDVISKEPLGPAVRATDAQWFNIVKWTHFAMVNAEELGVGMATIDAALASKKPDVRRLVGTDGNYGEQIGLTRDWAARIVRLVGNYGEAFDRNVGVKTPLGIPRGINHLWSAGGIMYAPPIR